MPCVDVMSTLMSSVLLCVCCSESWTVYMWLHMLNVHFHHAHTHTHTQCTLHTVYLGPRMQKVYTCMYVCKEEFRKHDANSQ